jgi:YebC/PmpR family DNA-binding regulatory protein
MAGHSHWARIKRAKAVTDARRGRAWSKLSRAITVATRVGGGEPESNLALRYAIDAARAENMPKDTIERAIKKGTGELGGASFEELSFEGYAPGGVAFLCLALTDNRARTAGEVRNVLDRNNSKLGVAGSVARLFTKLGVILVPAAAASEDRLTEIALEVGADDIRADADGFELRCDPAIYSVLRDALATAKIETASAELTMVASDTVAVSGDAAAQIMKLVDALEELDDVQNVYTNADISDEDLEKMDK